MALDSKRQSWVRRGVAGWTVVLVIVLGQGVVTPLSAGASAGTPAAGGGSVGSDGSLAVQSSGLALVSDKSSILAGESFTLTATSSGLLPPVSTVITDITTNTTLKTCTLSQTCSVSNSFFDGVVHQFVATAGSQTSPTVSVAGLPWSVALSADRTTFNAGQSVQLTATADQSVGATNNTYGIYIFDQSSNSLIQYCAPQRTTTSCSDTPQVPFYVGDPHDYIAIVASADPNVASYQDLTNIKATSNVVALGRAKSMVPETGARAAVLSSARS